MKANNERELRLVLTQNCNYSCVFCHGEGLQSKQTDNFTAKDYGFLFYIGKKYFGFGKTTLSGGEPLFRKDIVEIAQEIKAQKGIITVITNGALITQRPGLGKYVDRFNISLHTLDKDKYAFIVQRKNTFDSVLMGIKQIREENPDTEVRLNATIVKNTNETKKKILDYTSFAEGIAASVKFIELYPQKSKGFVPLSRVAKILENEKYEKDDSKPRGVIYSKKGSKIILSKIFCSCAVSCENPREYCNKYNDMFVTPEGKLKPCRVSLEEIDILQEVKRRDEKALRDKIKTAFEMLGKNCPLIRGENHE